MKRSSASGPPARGMLGGSGLAARRRAALVLASAALPYHLWILIEAVYGADRLVAVAALLGLGLSGVMVGVSRGPDALTRLPRWGLALAGLWVMVDLVQGALARQGLNLWMLIDVFALTLMLFAFLPAQRAAIWSLGVYAGFVAAALTAGQSDLTPLVATALVIGLAQYVASHGQAVAHEQAQVALLQRQLREDGLTGVLNRRAADEALRTLMREARGTLLFADVDHFKAINDRFGHLAGDEALRRVARCLRETVGAQGTVGRWGGEEFIVLLPGVEAAQGREVADRLLRAVRTVRDGTPPLTLSIGGADLTEASTLLGLIELADRRLYTAKDLGRDCAVLTDLADDPELGCAGERQKDPWPAS